MPLWNACPPEVQAAIRALVATLQQQLDLQRAEIERLRQRLEQNSSNSSQPPSADRPNVKRRPPRPASGRQRGGQPGHPPVARALPPADVVQPVFPSQCRRCQHPLHGSDPNPLRHPVVELPPIRPHITEYQLHRLRCPHCGLTTCAPLPAGVPAGYFGPRLQSVLALLAGAYRLSKRQIDSLCADLLGVSIATGTICALERSTAELLEPILAQLRDYVRLQSVNMDETSWREQRQRAWLWVAVTSTVTLFHIQRSRGAKVAQALLGPVYQCVLTSDRYSAYHWVALAQRQICWAHLKRDFQAMVDRNNAGSAIGETLLLLADVLFTWWYKVRDGTLSRPTFARRVTAVRADVQETLQRGSVCGCALTAGTCREIRKVEAALWTFVRVAGIEPTNNAAEQALRQAVQWRKTSYGTDSVSGSRFVSSILSVVATCRQQGRNVLEYLTACCQAALHGQQLPTLLPQENA
jgi:transposase